MLGWTDGRTTEIDGWTGGRTGDGQTDAQMAGRTTGGWADAGWMNVWTDARMLGGGGFLGGQTIGRRTLRWDRAGPKCRDVLGSWIDGPTNGRIGGRVMDR